jgi:tRNA (guanine-N7-)-methyltransferase
MYFCRVMRTNKLERFALMREMPHVLHFGFRDLQSGFHPLRGKWGKDHFKNDHPIILELGCGKGEYTVGLAQRYPDKNFIGLDVKGARMFIGATQCEQHKISNAAFLRTRIDFINAIFGEHEVDEVWITFPDPQKEKERKRLTHPRFLKRYARILKPGGIVHLKTDSQLLHEFTKEVIVQEKLIPVCADNDVYNTSQPLDSVLTEIQTTYEKKFRKLGMSITYVSFKLPEGYGADEPIFALDYRDGER